MNTLLSYRLALVFVICTLMVLLSGCILGGGGYYDGGGYYEPSGVVYGGWGPGYQVAPFRGGDHRPPDRGGHASARAYRPAPASHSMPTIPSQSRSGGGGGSHGGGGGGGKH